LEALLAKWEPEESDGDEDNDDGAQHYGILDGFQGEEDLEFFLNLDSGEVPFEMDEEPSFTSNKVCKIMHNRLKALKARFESFLDQMPVLTFNGSSYDLNLIKEYLPKYLCLSDPEEKSFVVKKNNKYLCISNRRLKFLDLTQYLAPGTSYENFLKSYEIAEKKAFFPYDYFSDIGKLEETCLPPMEAFYSELKKVNVLSAEYARYQMLLDKGMTPDKALKSMKLEKIPNTGEENYVWLQKLWKDEGMKTFADLLVYYNNTDVRPGLLAIEKMRQFYQDKGVCLFKSTISLPGVARLLLFRCAEKNKAYFALLGERDRDLHYKISKGIVGGASTIYRRFHEVGKTFIRNNPLKGVENIVGYDSNSLYLNALSREMPTGTPIRRHKKNGFKPEITHKHESMFHCLDYISLTENIAICHKQNSEHELRIGPYLMDGWLPNTNKLWEFQGCWWHACSCVKATNQNNKWLERKREETRLKREYLESEGYEVCYIRECDFKRQIKNDSLLSEFISSKRPVFYQKYPRAVSESTIIDAISWGLLYGIVDCDIQVPETWDQSHVEIDEEEGPQQYFGEFSPLFANTDIPFDKIGDHMQQHVIDKGLSQKPRRSLVGGMKAKRLLLGTPLLQWYINHGLQITAIYEVVEYNPLPCFREFGGMVTDARREGDKGGDSSVIPNTMKLIGNSGYGSLLINKMLHTNTRYVEGETNATRMVNSPRFKKMCPLPEELYEVESSKSRIVIDTPTILGFMILQYAKETMLRFYYDFLIEYCRKDCWEFMESDTDSIYIAISGQTIEDILKPEMRERFHKDLYGHCDEDKISATTYFFPRKCCHKHEKFDNREPGLFKLEFNGGTVMINLCSKTYFIKGRVGEKFSSKGISKKSVENPEQVFRNVLESRESQSCVNMGFRARNNTIFTYTQMRAGFAYHYVKREGLADGVSTKPLDITLCPWSEEELQCLEGRCGDECSVKAFCYKKRAEHKPHP
jgi:hypothetical protein